MDNNETVMVIMTMAILAATILSVTRMIIKRPRGNPTALDALEKRMARVEVALDDMTAEMGRMTESTQFLTKVLGDRQAIPVGRALPNG